MAQHCLCGRIPRDRQRSLCTRGAPLPSPALQGLPLGQQVSTPHTLGCHTASTGASLNRESPAQPANLNQSSPEAPRSQGPASPQQVRRLLRGSLRPSSIRGLELLQPLGGSTSFTPFWIRFKAVLHTSWPRRWLPRGSWLGPYRLGGRPGQSRTSRARDEPRSAGPGRGRQPCRAPRSGRRIPDPFPRCRAAVGHISGYRAAVGKPAVRCVLI